MILLRLLLILLCTTLLCSSLEIDWENCGEDKNCYVLGSCKKTSMDADKLDECERDHIVNKDCEIVITIKPYSSNKYLFTIRVKGKELATKKLGLYQGDDHVISCEEKDGIIDVALDNPDPRFSTMKLKMYENVSHFDATETVCAFTLTNPALFSSYKVKAITTIKFDEVKYEYRKKGTDMLGLALNRVRCDPDSIQDVTEKQLYRVLPIKNKAALAWDCSNYKRELDIPYDYHLYIKVVDTDAVRATEFKCNDVNSAFVFQFKDAKKDGEVVISDSFSAYCALELSKTCENPIVNCTEPLCPVYTTGDNDNDATLTCKDGRWFIDNNYYEGVQPICGTNSDNEAVFTMTYPDGKKKELTTGECHVKYDCKIKSSVDIIECDTKSNAADCGKVVTGDKLYCQDKHRVLTIYAGNTKQDGTSSFKCDETDGVYKNGATTIPYGARVTCTNLPEKEDPLMSDAAVAGISVGAACGSLLIAIVISAVIFLVITRKNRYRGAFINKEVWKLTSSSSKIAQALDTFGKAIVVRPDQDVTLLDALKLLDAIIESEFEDPDVWAAIDIFLKRFHAVAFYVDYEVERFFNRYCYLQAKKIIDKHGWISPTPITKSNPTGFIRTCAVRLLTMARRDDPDAQRLILDGFTKLQFNGIEQYPHCGLLWSLLSQQRVGSVKLHEEFIDKLLAIVHDRVNETEEEKAAIFENGRLVALRAKTTLKDNMIPEADRFPQFGSIKHQCSFAIGASDIGDMTKLGIDIMYTLENEDWASLSQSVMDGIFSSTSGNTYFTFMEIINYTSCSEEAQRKVYSLLLPSRVELERIITTLIFNRRFFDAKEREHRFDRRIKKEKLRQEREERDGKVVKEEPKEDYRGIADRDGRREGVDDSEGREKGTMREEDIKRMKDYEEEEKIDNEKGPTPTYDKVKEIHRLFVASFNNEKYDILGWLSGKIGRDEVKSQSKKESERMMTSQRVTSLSNSSNSLQVIDTTGKSKDQIFVDKFVSEFYKQFDVKRVTKSLLSTEEQTKYRSILDTILSQETVMGVRVNFDARDVTDICKRMVEVCRTEPVFIEDVPMGITVVTDLHGQIYDLARVFNAHAKDGKPGHETTRYLFTGDYVDRGDKALEVIMTLFILKILNPDRFWVLRGNHEFMSVNFHYGFMEEMVTRYETNVGQYLYYTLNESFMFLSICAIIGDQILCVHGGISTGTFTRHELRLLRKPISLPREDSIIQDMTWSDPAKAIGYFDNQSRGATNFFGEDVLLNALDRIECTGLLRGHSVLMKGYQKLWPSCIALFTATATDNRLNQGAVLRLFEDHTYQLVVLKHDPEREKVDKVHYGEKKIDPVTAREGKGEIHQRDE